MRIPNKGTPWLVGPDGQVRPATQNEVSEIWFRWLNDIDARVGNIPPPTPPAPPPPFSANIQFQDDGVDVGLANPRYVNARANLTATYDPLLNRIDLDATGGTDSVTRARRSVPLGFSGTHSAEGMLATTFGVGPSPQAFSTASFAATQNRIAFLHTAGNQNVGIYSGIASGATAGNVYFLAGNQPGMGGFTAQIRFAATVHAAGAQTWGGIGIAPASLNSDTPATYEDQITFGHTSGNWSLFHNQGANAPTVIDSGLAPLTGDVVDILISVPPNSRDYSVRVTMWRAGSFASALLMDTVLTTNVPNALVAQNLLGVHRSAAAITAGFLFFGMGIETQQ